MERYNQAIAVQEGYVESRKTDRLSVGWQAAVPTYAGLIFKYGFAFGFGAWSLAYLMPRQGVPNIPQSFGVVIWLVVTSIMAGLAGAGFGGLLAVLIKDYTYPYKKPLETVRALPEDAAPTDMKPFAMSRELPNRRIKFGKEKLSVTHWLRFAQPIINGGERMISQRRLEEWGVVGDRRSREARQIIEDLQNCGYAEEAGNSMYRVTEEFVDYLADMFPALTRR